MLHDTTASATADLEESRIIRRPRRSTPHSLIEADAAEYIGMSRSYLRVARRTGKGPAFVQAGRAINYRVSDLDAWLSEHRKVR